MNLVIGFFCTIFFINFRPQWRSVKKNRVFSVKNEKLFERSGFFKNKLLCKTKNI